MNVLKKLSALLKQVLEALYYLTFAVVGILSVPWLLSGSVKGRYSASGDFTPTNALGGTATTICAKSSGTTSSAFTTGNHTAVTFAPHLQGDAVWLVAALITVFILLTVLFTYQSIISNAISREAGLSRLIEFYGWNRYLQRLNAKIISADEFGTLYRKRFIAGESLAILAVKNSTAEPDGSFKTYYLRVPPHTKTAREAVAWTFAVETDQYRPTIET